MGKITKGSSEVYTTDLQRVKTLSLLWM